MAVPYGPSSYKPVDTFYSYSRSPFYIFELTDALLVTAYIFVPTGTHLVKDGINS